MLCALKTVPLENCDVALHDAAVFDTSNAHNSCDVPQPAEKSVVEGRFTLIPMSSLLGSPSVYETAYTPAVVIKNESPLTESGTYLIVDPDWTITDPNVLA